MTVTPGQDETVAVYVGTSGWQYRDWRGAFYPADLPQSRWLEYYAARFATVEVNNAFYRLPSRDTFVAWRNRTPDDFCVGVKMSRYLTHIKRLKDPAEPVQRFLDRATALGDRLGPVLLQLPPSLRIDLAALSETLSRFPSEVKVAVEPRHFHRRNGAFSVQAFSSYFALHNTDFRDNCQQPLESIWIRPPLDRRFAVSCI